MGDIAISSYILYFSLTILVGWIAHKKGRRVWLWAPLAFISPLIVLAILAPLKNLTKL